VLHRKLSLEKFPNPTEDSYPIAPTFGGHNCFRWKRVVMSVFLPTPAKGLPKKNTKLLRKFKLFRLNNDKIITDLVVAIHVLGAELFG